jgi:hypothetical protein
MSIYVMTLGELAKKRGEPVGDFVKKVQELGFLAGSHSKKLTQVDLNELVGLLDGTADNETATQVTSEEKDAVNPNVLILKLPNGKRSVLFVDASIDEQGVVSIEVLENSTENTYGESLLEFRKQLGMKLGIR